MLGYNELIFDPRISQAKELILQVLEEKQREIRGIRPPIAEHQENYESLLRRVNQLRGAPLYYPYIGSGFGKGCLVELHDGSVKYDFISGIGVHYWGHSHPEIISSNIDAAIADTVMQGHLQQNWDTVQLMELLTQTSGFDHCFLTSSGAMANENGLKILFQNKAPAQRILAFEHCFMGRTTTLSQITDKAAYRLGIPETIDVDYIPFYDPQKPEESIQKAVDTLKVLLHRHPKKYAAMCMELVQGEGGFNVGNTDFFKAIIAVLKNENIGILVDEVQSFGRTPELFAFQHFGLEGLVDVVTIGKLTQVCATLFNKDIAPKPGLLSQTFTSSTSAIRAGLLIVKKLSEGRYYGPEGKISFIHRLFEEQLEALHRKYPTLIKGPWGIGTMIAFTPYGGDFDKVTDFAKRLFSKGVISFIAGQHPTRIRFLVPIEALSIDDINAVMKLIEETLIEPTLPMVQ
jgi:4-aminobutyrate aminotransferase-like enzyme